MDPKQTDNLEILFQDFWKRIENLMIILKKKDIKNLYKDHRPLTKLELDFLYKKYNDTILSYLYETDNPESIYDPDNYRTAEESIIAKKNAYTAVHEAYAAGVLDKCVSPIDKIRAVIKYRDNICHFCKIKANLLCAKCKSVRYCGSECQKSDWKNHKKNCKSK
jgi:hypothetical protein